MKKGFLCGGSPRSSAAAKSSADTRDAIANPDGAPCCFVKCNALTHKVWVYRTSASGRVWVGAEHRCVYIPHSGKSDWKLYKPSPSQIPAAAAPSAAMAALPTMPQQSTGVDHSKSSQLDTSDDDTD